MSLKFRCEMKLKKTEIRRYQGLGNEIAGMFSANKNRKLNVQDAGENGCIHFLIDQLWLKG